MLNLNVDVDVKLNKTEMPIYFDGTNECVKCAGKDTLEFIDKFGNRHTDEIRAFDHIRCKKCGAIYSILWQRRDDSNKMYPSAVEPNIVQDFKNLVNRTLKYNGEKNFIN